MDIRTRILNARKNFPPLRSNLWIEKQEEILFDTISGNETIFGKLLRHKAAIRRDHDDDGEEKSKRKNPSWRQLKEKMMEDLERRRDDEWQQQQAIQKQEEELNEEEEDEEDSSEEEETPPADVNENESSSDQDVESENNEVSDHDNDNNNADGDDENEDEIMSFLKKKAFDLIQNKFDQNDDDDDDEHHPVFISQNFVLTPPTKPDSRIQIVNNDNNYDSQMLIDLCSGKFDTQNVPIIQNDPRDDSSDDDNDGDDSEEDESSESDLADDEEDDDHQNGDLDDDEIKISKPKKMKVADFFEDEAELSGDEDAFSSDEDDADDGGAEFLEDLIGNDPDQDDEEIRGQVEKIHHKNMLDEDKRQLMIMKEYFLENGDLDDGSDGVRKKKFRWNFGNENLADFLQTGSLSSDSDSQNEDEEDEVENTTVINRLKRTIDQVDQLERDEPIATNAVDDDDVQEEENEEHVQHHQEDDDNRTKRMRTLDLHAEILMKRTLMKKRQQSSIQSFVIRDQRLHEVLKCNGFGTKKRSMGNKNPNVSIFDVL